jgi:hypothetical protein
MLSVKIYRNWRRNFCYGIYFNKFHAICKGKFQKCDHIYLVVLLIVFCKIDKLTLLSIKEVAALVFIKTIKYYEYELHFKER